MSHWLENKVKQGFETNNEAPLGTPDNPSSKVFTIANAITIMRMALTAVFLWMFIDDVNRYISVAIYALAACTDWMDGQIARKTQTVSWFGKLLDPVCDRFLLFCGVLGLVIRAELPIWVAIFVIGRDVYLAIGAMIVRKYRKRPIDVVYIGKITTALLMFGFADLLLGLPVLPAFSVTNFDWLPLLNSVDGPLGLLFVYAGCICSFITAIVYTIEGRAVIAAAKNRMNAVANNSAPSSVEGNAVADKNPDEETSEVMSEASKTTNNSESE